MYQPEQDLSDASDPERALLLRLWLKGCRCWSVHILPEFLLDARVSKEVVGVRWPPVDNQSGACSSFMLYEGVELEEGQFSNSYLIDAMRRGVAHASSDERQVDRRVFE